MTERLKVRLDSCQDCAIEHQWKCSTGLPTSHELFPKAAKHLPVCHPWHPANAAHDPSTHNRTGLFCIFVYGTTVFSEPLAKKPQGRLIVKNIHLVLCGLLEWGPSSPDKPRTRNDSRLFFTARLRYALPCFTLASPKEPPLDYRPDYALFENRLSLP